MSTEHETIESTEETGNESSIMRVIGWFSAGVAVAAVGILVGRELRSHYRFRRRTPYDFYSNSSEVELGEFGEFGVGV
jgi:hypothetical protein